MSVVLKSHNEYHCFYDYDHNDRRSIMKKRVNVRFRQETGKKDIDVLFTAAEKDNDVASLMDRVKDPLSGTLNVKDSEGATVVLPEKQIVSISSGSKKLKIQADEGTYEMKAALRDVEQWLHPVSFLRISRYEIINLDKVKKFDFSISGSLRIEMKDGMETWASRRFIPEIKTRLKISRSSGNN